MLDVNFKNVERLYPGHTGIALNEFWIEGQGWIEANEEVKAKGTIDDQLLFVLSQGSTTVNLNVVQANGQVATPDYHTYELIND